MKNFMAEKLQKTPLQEFEKVQLYSCLILTILGLEECYTTRREWFSQFYIFKLIFNRKRCLSVD